MIDNGLGRDIWTVPFDDITMMFKVCSFNPVFHGKSLTHSAAFLHQPVPLPGYRRPHKDINCTFVPPNLP